MERKKIKFQDPKRHNSNYDCEVIFETHIFQHFSLCNSSTLRRYTPVHNTLYVSAAKFPNSYGRFKKKSFQLTNKNSLLN